MNQQANDNQATTNPKKPFVITWKLAAAIVLSCFAVGCSCCSFIFATSDWSSQITDQDYDTNQERLNYLNGVLPFTLPASTTVKRFKIEGFQDWFLEADISIPPAELDTFLNSIPELEPTDSANQYEARFGGDHMDIDVDPETGEIHLEYIET